MIKDIEKRLERLEAGTGAGLPNVLHLDGTESPPSLWLPGTSLESAQSANESTQLLRERLEQIDHVFGLNTYLPGEDEPEC